MRDYHPGRLPFFARRNSHFDQFEFFAGPVTLARPHLRLATFCATILISSSPLSPIPLVSFLTLSLSLFPQFQTSVSFLWYLSCTYTSNVTSHPFFGSQWFIPLSDDVFLATFEELLNTASRWRMDGRGAWLDSRPSSVYIHAFLFLLPSSRFYVASIHVRIDLTGEKFVTFVPLVPSRDFSGARD